MPIIGLGTFRVKGEICQKAVEHALATGYRHIDTAECYRNGTDIAKGIASFIGKQTKHQIKHQNMTNTAESKEETNNDAQCNGAQVISRSDLFISSKLSPRSMKSQSKMESAINGCLKALNTEYIDLFLIHWPGVSGKKMNDPKQAHHRMMAWKVMEKYVNNGYLRCIGVSNFEIGHLKPLIDAHVDGNLQYKVAVNQIEFHPFYQRTELMEYCKENDIQIGAYGSLGAAESHHPENLKNGKHMLLDHPVVLQLSRKYNKTAAQILLRYGVDCGCTVIPKSINSKRIDENFDVFDFELNREDLAKIGCISMGKHQKFAWNSENIL